jgi:hypothetical protein
VAAQEVPAAAAEVALPQVRPVAALRAPGGGAVAALRVGTPQVGGPHSARVGGLHRGEAHRMGLGKGLQSSREVHKQGSS